MAGTFLYQPVNNDIKKYKNIWKIAAGQRYDLQPSACLIIHASKKTPSW